MGRGSSSAGGSGNINPNDVKSTYDMISNRGANPQGTDEVLSVARDIVDMYGDRVALPGTFQVAQMKKSGSRTMAYYDTEGNIAVNEKFFDPVVMNSAYDDCVSAGFHPSRGNKTGLQATAAHEYGHALADLVAKKMGKDIYGASDEIVNEARGVLASRIGKKGRTRTSDLQKMISGYAEKNNAETIAEAYSDVYCNGRRASVASRAVVDVLNKYLL